MSAQEEPRKVDRVVFRLDEERLGQEISRRSRPRDQNVRARMDLGRFYALLLTALPLPFTSEEAARIIAEGAAFIEMSDERWTPTMLKLQIAASVLDARRTQITGTDVADIAQRICVLTPLQAVALVDAIERYSVGQGVSPAQAFGIDGDN